MTVRVSRWLALLVSVATLATACQDGTPVPAPSPSPTTVVAAPTPVDPGGLSAAFVLPPPAVASPAELEALREDLARLRRTHLRDVTTWRVVAADGPEFVGDLVALFAEDGADLVCAIGPRSGDVVVRIASAFPETRFCATPAIAELALIPANVLLIDLRVEEVAYLAGVAAQLTSAPGAPGFVAGDTRYSVDRQRLAFQLGINAVSETPVAPYVAFPVGDPERALELAAPQYAAGVGTIFSTAGAADAGVRRAAQENDGLVIGSLRTLVPDPGEAPPAAVLFTISERFDVPVGIAVDRALASWEGGLASVGLAQDVFTLAPGGSPRYRAIAPRLDELQARIEADQLQPLGAG